MAEDWAAVAKAIDQRMRELSLRQRELAERSHVSQAIIREIQHHTVERRRSARTLEALSIALEWHPGHLSAVLSGRRPPQPGEANHDDVPARLAAIEEHLREITERLDALSAGLAAVVPPTRRDTR
ncbi:hypothetical protein SAMN05421810_104202 [Amycolatopsis arida]|uniref:XRE family transcriptional regulator n=1 Tax=Amycolatopsis arida TaxID=587909 RepID=A0A1I5V1Y3_9PSEU|nr:transcriptional regulator [Amycolatopsis arida]TDX91119.1 hypothetical protein CLV69_106201 [Amycolatopsis arida]SFQ01564.1 hypothetical protein SAMN05421810_104202 [Amycolatopsis arida]